MHSRVPAFLTHPCSPGGDTVPENRCWQMADRLISQCFNCIVHRRLWVKVHKIFHTCTAPQGLFTAKVWGGLQQKILRESPKTGNFCTCTCKSSHCVYLGGSKVKVERTPC